MSESQNDGPSSSTITHAVSNRPEMVEAARKFFTNPKVRSTPFQEQKQFLFDKGVTSAEIDEALASISPVEVAASSSPNAVVVNHPVSPQNKLVTFTQSVVMIGGVSYMAYKLVRSWVLPRFFGVPDPADEQMQNLQTQINELQNSTKFIMDSVEQTLQTVSAQQEQLNRALLMMHSGGK
uniref:Peroxisomal membrane protein PEX14 n=1 Tax=Acrobeloides nanus TaxID=290746 RepID=A0A914EEX9_9BILA